MISSKSKILVGFLLYGVLVGLLSFWWWGISDNILLLNIPGELIGYEVYNIAISLFGDPFSPQAHFSIPWILRIPEVFIPVSIICWGAIGLVFQIVYSILKRAKS
jgi:hypothetical protein